MINSPLLFKTFSGKFSPSLSVSLSLSLPSLFIWFVFLVTKFWWIFKEGPMWQKQPSRSSYRESIKALEADIQHANNLCVKTSKFLILCFIPWSLMEYLCAYLWLWLINYQITSFHIIVWSLMLFSVLVLWFWFPFSCGQGWIQDSSIGWAE